MSVIVENKLDLLLLNIKKLIFSDLKVPAVSDFNFLVFKNS